MHSLKLVVPNATSLTLYQIVEYAYQQNEAADEESINVVRSRRTEEILEQFERILKSFLDNGNRSRKMLWGKMRKLSGQLINNNHVSTINGMETVAMKIDLVTLDVRWTKNGYKSANKENPKIRQKTNNPNVQPGPQAVYNGCHPNIKNQPSNT